MKAKTFILTLLTGLILTTPVYASPEYSEETKRLMQEAGLGQEYTVDEIMARQEALKSGQANNSTPATQNGQNKANSTTTRRIKGGVDEYRVVAGGGKDSTQVTDTKDELHVYSNEYANGYNNANYGAKNSYDEFHTAPYDIDANDGYGAGGFDEIHVNENYRQNVWKPDYKVQRLGIDQFKLPNEL